MPRAGQRISLGDRLKSTAERILDSVEHLIEERGFNAISYQDIANDIGISKPSIHHHFSTKAALGTAVIRRYRERLREHAEQLGALTAPTDPDGYWNALELYLKPSLAFAETPDKICLGGILCAEFQTLEPGMQQEGPRFFTEQQDWLAAHFARGREAGALAFQSDPEQLARMFFAAIEGGLLVGRTSGEPTRINAVLDVLRSMLRGDA